MTQTYLTKNFETKTRIQRLEIYVASRKREETLKGLNKDLENWRVPRQDDICEPQQYCQYPNTQQIVNVISAVKLRKICVCYKLTMLNKQYYGKKQWQLH